MLYAVLGSNKSFYGNIGYAQAPLPIKTYGGWPEEHPNIQDVPLVVEAEQVRIEEKVQPRNEEVILNNIAIIRRLRAELAATHDIARRERLRQQIAAARKAKEDAFKLQARIDEEETAFMLLH